MRKGLKSNVKICVLAMLLVSSCFVCSCKKSEPEVPIELVLPKAMFVGTPQDTKVENLEKPLGRPRSEFLAPKGTKNVALGKPVSSSDEMPIIGEIEMITDDDKEAADGS